VVVAGEQITKEASTQTTCCHQGRGLRAALHPRKSRSYRLQGVHISDMHIEIIIRQCCASTASTKAATRTSSQAAG
jgi:hypothetical protein